MFETITEGFNLVFRWMGIWLACNITTDVLYTVEDWMAERRRMREDGQCVNDATAILECHDDADD